MPSSRSVWPAWTAKISAKGGVRSWRSASHNSRGNSASPHVVRERRGEELQRRQHRLRHVRRAVTPAELHRLDAIRVGLVDRALDTLAGFGCGLQAVLVGEPL